MDPKDMHVRICQEEMESLLNLKYRLDHEEAVSSYAEKYQKLGWVLQAMDSQAGSDLGVDFGENPETMVNRLWEPGLSGPEINLGVCTGKESGLMVLEVAKGLGESSLDQYGLWRAECIAALGAMWEQHFYAWDPSPLFDSVTWLTTPEVRWSGEGQVVPVPPSFDPETQESSRWLCPPWERAPQSPSQSLLIFLEQHLTREPQPRPEVSLSWQQVYCLVSPHEALLKALSTSYSSMQSYYQGILQAAVAVGFTAPEVLLSLLWHAPQGNARQHPEIWGHLQKLAAEAQPQPDPATSPGNAPWELFLDNALSLARETSVCRSVPAADQTGPPCFLHRCLVKPPQPGANFRTPFSCRKIRGYLKKNLTGPDRADLPEE
jgi:hypothetical protein